MSSWGLTDNVAIAGTVTTYATNTTLTGASTYFSSNLNPGDYITITGVTGKNQVASITSNTSLVLEVIPRTVVSSKVAYAQTGPKSIHSSNAYALSRQSNVYSIENTYGVTLNEMYSNSVSSTTISNVGAGYRAFTNVNAATANTTALIATTGVFQPTSNATATLTFTANTLTSITISNPGAGYTEAAKSNTTIVIATTGASQPTTNATANLVFTSASTVQTNAHHTGWVSYVTYTTSQGETREKQETLVALSKNFTGTSAGDAADDSIFGD